MGMHFCSNGNACATAESYLVRKGLTTPGKEVQGDTVACFPSEPHSAKRLALSTSPETISSNRIHRIASLVLLLEHPWLPPCLMRDSSSDSLARQQILHCSLYTASASSKRLHVPLKFEETHVIQLLELCLIAHLPH